jgi:hypothetical protein
MGRWYLSVTATALMVWATCVGTAGAGPLSFGIKAGLTVSSITETPDAWNPEKSFKPGLAAGAFLVYAFDNGLSIQPEFLYSQKGVSTSLYEGIVDVDMDLNLAYFELPLLLKYTFPLQSSFKPEIFAGPSIAYSLSSELELAAGIVSGGVDFSSMTHVTDFGIVLGAGFAWDVGNGMITFDGRYTRGFTNVILSGDFTINGDTQTIEEDDFKNHGMVFMLGYVF